MDWHARLVPSWAVSNTIESGLNSRFHRRYALRPHQALGNLPPQPSTNTGP
jgi:hypothetical protein